MFFVALILSGLLAICVAQFVSRTRAGPGMVLLGLAGFGAFAVFSYPPFHIGSAFPISALFGSFEAMLIWPVAVAGVAAGGVVGVLGRWVGGWGLSVLAGVMGALTYFLGLVLLLAWTEG